MRLTNHTRVANAIATKVRRKPRRIVSVLDISKQAGVDIKQTLATFKALVKQGKMVWLEKGYKAKATPLFFERET